MLEAGMVGELEGRCPRTDPTLLCTTTPAHVAQGSAVAFRLSCTHGHVQLFWVRARDHISSKLSGVPGAAGLLNSVFSSNGYTFKT